MVTLAIARLVVLCALVVTAGCGRKTVPPDVAREPRPAEAQAEPGFAPPRAASPVEETESAVWDDGAQEQPAWPSAQHGAARQKRADRSGDERKEANAAEYDSYSQKTAPERRPGLATQYGERRDSAITHVRFERDDEDRPSALLSLFYDDESGVEAKTGRDGDDATPGVFPLHRGAVEVSVVSSWDNPLPYLYGNGRTFIIGDSSDRYVIRLTNHSRERYEVVASVDGLDVITGSEATLRHHGYILAPWSTLRIEGFRESMDAVRAFRFGEPSESYAVGRGYGRDIGVIGVALFGERTYRYSPSPNPFPGGFAPPPNY